MQPINRIDILIMAMVTLFLLNMVALIYGEDESLFITVVGAVVTLVGYAFIRPVIVSECELNGGINRNA